MADYRVWGIKPDGLRDLIGMVHADGMGEAVSIIARMPKPSVNYPGMVIEKIDLEGPRAALRLVSDPNK